MGLRGTSFELAHKGTLPSNAGLVTAWFGSQDVTITFEGREIPTKTVWSDSLSEEPQATLYSMLRPTTGDWPIGQMSVVVKRYPQVVVAEIPVNVGPAVDAGPPKVVYVSGRMDWSGMSFPGGGSEGPSARFGYTINDPNGAFVSIEVEYTVTNHTHPCRRTQIGQTHGTIKLEPTLDTIKRIRFTSLIGKTLEVLPPFPQGTPPAGPAGQPRF